MELVPFAVERERESLCRRSPLSTAIPGFGFEGHFTAAVSRGRRPVDCAAGPALRLIDLTHVREYSRATHDDIFFCFLRSDRTKTGVGLLSFLLPSLRLTKTVLKPKKRPCKHSSRLSGRLLVSEFFQSEKAKIVGRPTASIGRSPLSKPKEHRHAKLELKERAIFPVPLMVQEFDRCAQTPIVRSMTHKQT